MHVYIYLYEDVRRTYTYTYDWTHTLISNARSFIAMLIFIRMLIPVRVFIPKCIRVLHAHTHVYLYVNN